MRSSRLSFPVATISVQNLLVSHFDDKCKKDIIAGNLDPSSNPRNKTDQNDKTVSVKHIKSGFDMDSRASTTYVYTAIARPKRAHTTDFLFIFELFSFSFL